MSRHSSVILESWHKATAAKRVRIRHRHRYILAFKKSLGEGEIKQNLELNFQGTAEHQGH